MPYIMVMGNLSAPHLANNEGATVYGLKNEERATLVRDLNASFGMTIATLVDSERTVKVQKGLTLVVVNRIHALLGYDVTSHAMAMTNANRELVSFTMYKKSSGHSHSHGHGGPGKSSSRRKSPSNSHSTSQGGGGGGGGGVVTL
ncbi:unnamed protein product [Plutella xylostella]|uniref:(diamondback moth) hypothetical protein n=1 Tax=Plutella xylostella TaxID=51655 RepID=A0A8S4D0P6_PLUXY|nr:unnamed protein product [Plutella xylostella]